MNGRLACPTCRPLLEVESYGVAQWAQSGLPRSGLVQRTVLSARRGILAAIALVLALTAAIVGSSIFSPAGADALTGASGDSTPAEVVRHHYSLLAAHNSQAAWQLLSPSLQAQFGFQTWANSYTWLWIEPITLEVVSRTSTAATVAGTVVVHEDNAIARTSQGRWTLALVDGGWHLDSASVDSPTALATATPLASELVWFGQSMPAQPTKSETATQTSSTPPATATPAPTEAPALSTPIVESPTAAAMKPAATPPATKSATPTAVSSGARTATVSTGTSERVRLRRGPSTSYGVIVNLANGTKVTILKAVTGETVGTGSSRWYYVSWRASSGAVGRGYVYGSFVKLSS